MICPFDVPEKQALLECPDLSQRAKLLIAILEMASHADDDENTAKH
jgi:Lon protease-like protein